MSNIIQIPGRSQYIDLDKIVSIQGPHFISRTRNIQYIIYCQLMENPLEICYYDVPFIPMYVIDRDRIPPSYLSFMPETKINPEYKQEVFEQFKDYGCYAGHPVLNEDGKCTRLEEAKKDMSLLIAKWEATTK